MLSCCSFLSLNVDLRIDLRFTWGYDNNHNPLTSLASANVNLQRRLDSFNIIVVEIRIFREKNLGQTFLVNKNFGLIKEILEENELWSKKIFRKLKNMIEKN